MKINLYAVTVECLNPSDRRLFSVTYFATDKERANALAMTLRLANSLKEPRDGCVLVECPIRHVSEPSHIEL